MGNVNKGLFSQLALGISFSKAPQLDLTSDDLGAQIIGSIDVRSTNSLLQTPTGFATKIGLTASPSTLQVAVNMTSPKYQTWYNAFVNGLGDLGIVTVNTDYYKDANDQEVSATSAVDGAEFIEFQVGKITGYTKPTSAEDTAGHFTIMVGKLVNQDWASV